MPLLHPSMMPNHSILPRQIFEAIFSICFVLVVLGLSTVSAADGDLDPAFVPDTDFPDKALGLGVIEGKYYFSHSSRNGRLLEDGQLDPDWSLEYAGRRIISEIWQTPSGGLVFNDLGRVLLQTDQATPHDIGYARSAGADSPLVFPQADGWIVIGPLLSRVSEEGEKDPAYGSRLSYEAASFNDGAGRGIVGGPSVTMIQDELNRFIVAGNIKQIGDTVRLGLARLLPNGQLDPDWDVASALGIELSEDNYLNALPISLASGPMNQLVVGLQLISTNGEPNIEFAVLDADGAVVSRFQNPGFRQPATPVVQPDGRILIGGTLKGEPDTPLEAVVRLHADGTLDETFEVGISSGTGWVQIRNLSLDDRGRLYVFGAFDRVNGAPRPGLARIHAYEPIPGAPSLQIAYQQPRIGTNEYLYLTANVRGVPKPELQWFLNGVELPSQTHAGLRVWVENEEQVGNYTVVARNAGGTEELEFAPVALAVRSARPGVVDQTYQRTLVVFPNVTQLMSLPDGSVLVGGGDLYAQTSAPWAMVGKLNPDGYLEPDFGEDGMVKGNGFVESLRVLPDGGILVAGVFTEFAGVQAYGLAELDAQGQLVPRNWPELDVPHVSAALRLPDGRQVIAGRFSTVVGESAYRLARLNGDLTLDDTFTSLLEPWQFVDDLELDSMGRLLIAGARMFAVETITNPPPAGLQRLLEDGTADPAFQKYEGNVRDVVVEPDGRLLTLGSVNGYLAPNRLTPDGALVVQFEQGGQPDFSLSMFPDHSMLRLPDGSVVGAITDFSDRRLIRWHSNGLIDYNFSSIIGTNSAGPILQAITLLPDEALLVSTRISGTVIDPFPPAETRRLVRIPSDSDARLLLEMKDDAGLTVHIATHPGKAYLIRTRPSLGAAPTLLGIMIGDGYGQEFRIEANGAALFIDFQAELIEP